MHVLDDTTLLSRKQVIEVTGLSRATIDRMRKDDDFPQPLQLSPRRVAWRAADVREWVASRKIASPMGQTKTVHVP